MYKLLTFLLLLLHYCYGYNVNIALSRRNMILNTAKFMCATTIYKQFPANAQTEENRPLTPEEMEEYKKLLKDAEIIESVINANKKAFLEVENNSTKTK